MEFMLPFSEYPPLPPNPQGVRVFGINWPHPPCHIIVWGTQISVGSWRRADTETVVKTASPAT